MSDLQRHGATEHELATVDSERFPVPDPGEPEHLPRLTDIDEAAANRATRQVATMFGLVPILALIFVVCYSRFRKTRSSTSARCTRQPSTSSSVSRSGWRCC